MINRMSGGDSIGPEADGDPAGWDAHDQRRQQDQMAPPEQPCECHCLHCRRVFTSDQMWFQKVIGSRDGFEGFWMCPTPNCDGAGFTFDIFPTDPDHPANPGWSDDDEVDDEADDEAKPGSWDPEEKLYQELEEEYGEDDDDLEGEEWKHGLAPGERPTIEWSEQTNAEWEEEQKRYDAPDERPRELDWTGRDATPPGEDDIPF